MRYTSYRNYRLRNYDTFLRKSQNRKKIFLKRNKRKCVILRQKIIQNHAFSRVYSYYRREITDGITQVAEL